MVDDEVEGILVADGVVLAGPVQEVGDPGQLDSTETLLISVSSDPEKGLALYREDIK